MAIRVAPQTRPAAITSNYCNFFVMYRAQGQAWQFYQSCDFQEDARILTMRCRDEHAGQNIDTLVLRKVDEWTTLTDEERK